MSWILLANLMVLLFMYQLKHFICDYLLQGEYMLQKFLPDWGFVLPLLAHVGVHGVGTAVIAVLFGAPELALPLAMFDAGVHFVMDRIKAGPRYLGRFKPLTAAEYGAHKYYASCGFPESKKRLRGNKLFWWSLGFDQMVHHLTHYVCIASILFFGNFS